MSRPLRIDIADGWYHVTSRGIERRVIFENNNEHKHFLELLEEMVDRFRVVLHGHAELDNHYHLILQTPEANLSAAIQWLNVSHVAWVNRRRNRVGPLMQGRFKSIPVQNSAWAYELSLYVHLNPVMRTAHGLGKQNKKAESIGFVAPDRETVTRRLAELRTYPWSSYRAYAGYAEIPKWLSTKDILRRVSRKKDQCAKSYRKDIRQRLTKGVEPKLKERLADRFAIGAEEFKSQIRKTAGGGREISGTRELRKRMSFEDLVGIVECIFGKKQVVFMNQHGDWARPLLLWAAHKYTGMTLKQIGEAAGGMDYTAVAMAIKRFKGKAAGDPYLRRIMNKAKHECEM